MAAGPTSVTVCGLMSGTSADGIDIAVVEITDPSDDRDGDEGLGSGGQPVPVAPGFRLLRFAEVPWATEDRRLILELQVSGDHPVGNKQSLCSWQRARQLLRHNCVAMQGYLVDMHT